ncbi:MAG: minor capsid protein [Clostridiales bacterium]|nr:minor capsid protein [Clostridiales bacterium]
MPMDYDLSTAFQRIEDELISSMMRNLSRHRAEETAEGFQWSQWQTEQLAALSDYSKVNSGKFSKRYFSTLNGKISEALKDSYSSGETTQEAAILQAIQSGSSARQQTDTLSGSFFRTNQRKLNALVKATTDDMAQAETAVLRRANDAYRKVIYDAQVYANTGAGTYEKAVDMATKDFLAAGIQCVEYSNGARHTLSDYADMAIKTASKRAYLQGEGDKRQEWGVSTVIVNKRGNACPKCARFCGKVFIDDVWSGGKRSDGNYPLLSAAIAQGLYHPRCKDSHSTWFPELHQDATPYTKQEIAQLEGAEQVEQRQQYAQRQAEKYRRMEKYSLDGDNQRKYGNLAEQWEKEVAKGEKSGIIKQASDRDEVPDVRQVCNLDPELYQCVTNDIATDEVVITEKQIEHIKERHPDDYEICARWAEIIICDPDYIIRSEKPNTAIVLRQVEEHGKKYRLILRLKTSEDPENYKNSIITFQKVKEKEWRRLLRNKEILYKRE